jgi:hypothetical protein
VQQPAGDRERTRSEVARVRRSLLIIFGVGGLGTAIAIAYVLRNMPAMPSDASGVPAPLPCRKFGDPCQLAPGKLGACMQRENCTGPGCYFCQSQH